MTGMALCGQDGAPTLRQTAGVPCCMQDTVFLDAGECSDPNVVEVPTNNGPMEDACLHAQSSLLLEQMAIPETTLKRLQKPALSGCLGRAAVRMMPMSVRSCLN